MWERILVILKKEFIQVFREPRMRGMLLIAPLMQLIIFGYAVTLDLDNAKIAWMDGDRTPASRALLARFLGSGRFQLAATPSSEAELTSILDHGDAHAAIRVMPGFAADLARGRTAEVQILLDGTNSNTASLVSAYAGGVIAAYSSDVSRFPLKNHETIKLSVRSPGAPPAAAAAGAAPEARVWFNPDLRSRNYFVPGVAVNILFMITLSLTAQAIIREKEIGTMEQLMVTPMRSIELMLGKTLPFALIGILDLLIVVAGALLIFRVPFRGNFFVLLFSATIFLLTSLGAGLFLSTISRTQQQANMVSFFFSSPAFMLSGFNFPIRNMPVLVQYLTYINPLRYFMEIVRGVFLKGVGVAALWPNILALLVFGSIILALSAIRFHKTLD